jgi:uncharacterized repeat protein (TIGR02543 family)
MLAVAVMILSALAILPGAGTADAKSAVVTDESGATVTYYPPYDEDLDGGFILTCIAPAGTHFEWFLSATYTAGGGLEKTKFWGPVNYTSSTPITEQPFAVEGLHDLPYGSYTITGEYDNQGPKSTELVHFNIVEDGSVDKPVAATGLVYDGTVQTGVPAGTGYTLTGTASTARAGNYTVTAKLNAGYTWPDSTTGDVVLNWSIAPKTVSIEWSATDSFVYDGASHVRQASLTGVISEDECTPTITGERTDAGTEYTATVTGLTGLNNSDYALPASGTTSTFGITKHPVEITGLSVSDKVYDGTAAATATGTPALSWKYSSDAVTIVSGTCAFSQTDVGTDISVTFTGYSLSGDDSGNYELTAQPSGSADITPRPAIITADSKTKTYGGSDPEFTGTVTGLVASEDLGTVSYARIPADVGKENVTDTIHIGATYTDNPNYSVTVTQGILKISKATMHVTPTAVTVTYGTATEAVEYDYALTADDLKNGDTAEAVKEAITGAATYLVAGNAYAPTLAVGNNYALTMDVGTLTNGNYTIVLAETYDVKFTVSKATITLTPNEEQKSQYKSAGDYEITYTLEGVMNEETAGHTGALAVATNAVGSTTVVQGTFALANNESFLVSNYNLVFTADVAYTITPQLVEKPTPDTAVFTYTGSEQTYNPVGFVANTMEISGNVQTNASTDGYDVSVTLKDTDNYNWSDNTTGPVAFKFVIAKAVLTATYAGETVTYGTVPDLDVTVTGFVNDETAATAAGYVAPTLTTDKKNVGDYQLTPSGGAASNYSFEYAAGTLKISKATMHVTPIAVTVTYGTAADSVEYGFELVKADLKNDDTAEVVKAAISGEPAYLVAGAAYAPTLGADQSGYALTMQAGTLTNANYEIAVADTYDVKFVVEPAQLTLTPTSGQTSKYDPENGYVINFELTGAKNGETAAYDGKLAVENNAVGAQKILKNGFALKDEGAFKAANYELDFVENETYEITPKLVVKPTADQTEFTYTGSELTYNPVGFDANTMGISGNVQTNASTDGYDVSVTLKDSTNYHWSDNTTGPVAFKFVIAKVNPTYTAPVAKTDLVYDGTEKVLITGGTSSHGTFSYSLDGTTYSEVLPKATEKGAHTVYWKLTGDANHYDASGTVTAAIGVYTIAFNANGGSCSTSTMITDGNGKLSSLPSASRSGYNFSGWYTSASGGTKVTTSYEFDQDMTVYAHWTAKAVTYTITFDGNGGTPEKVNKTTRTNGRLASLPSDPVWEGHQFDGWYKSRVSSVKVTASTVFSYNATVYAHWSEYSLGIAYYANGGSGSMDYQLIKYSDTSKILDANAFSRDGYVFAGWNTAIDGSGTSYSDRQDVSGLIVDANADLRLYAQWTAIRTVTFAVSEEGYGTVSKQSVVVTDGASIKAVSNNLAVGNEKITATPAADTDQYHYAFVGWTGIPADGKVTSDITVTADFTRAENAYTVTIAVSDDGYGTVDRNSITVGYGAVVSASDNILYVGEERITATPAADIDQYSYIFVGWTGIPADGKVTSDITVTADFAREDRRCNVTFTVSEGVTKVVKVIPGKTVTPIADPKLAGVEFKGWFLEGSNVRFNFSTPINEDTILYAHFGPKAPSTDQTSKITAVMSKDLTAVVTAYDGKIVGKGTMHVSVYQLMTIRDMQVYVEIGTFEESFDCSRPYFISDVSKRTHSIASGPGSYAVMAEIDLDNGTERLSNYTTFNKEGGI